MLMPDVNVLVYAHRSDSPVHETYRAWLEEQVRRPSPFALSTLVVGDFIRAVTNPKTFKQPTQSSLAWATVDALLARPNCRVLSPGPNHLAIFADLCRKVNARGKAVADAQHATMALEHGCTWVSRDDDFHAYVPLGLRFEHLVP